MENSTNIGDCYLLKEQIDDTSDNIDHNSSQEHYNISLEESITICINANAYSLSYAWSSY